MDNSTKTLVIIVNFNGKEFLGRCLESLQRQVFSNFKTVVVDNCSHDRSVDGLEERFPDVEVVRLEENIGFAAANNYAIKKTEGFYLGADKQRWKGIYLSSHIDVSGSELIISSPSSSAADEAFNIIGIIKDYEKDNFGEVTTDLSDPEKVVNMYVYIVGEDIVNDYKEKEKLN